MAGCVRQAASWGQAISVIVLVLWALTPSGLSAEAVRAEPNQDGPATGAKLVAEIKATGITKVAIVAVRGALDAAARDALLEKGAAAGLTLLLKEIDLKSAEELAAEMEKVRTSGAEAVLPLGDASATQSILQQMRNLAFAQPALLYEADGKGGTKLMTKSVMPVLETVLDEKRSQSTDILLLRNGDKLTGQVMNPSISMRTSYASQLKFETRLIAGLLFEGQAYMETLFSVNGNRFSGFIDDPVISFKIAGGGTIPIRKEKIAKVVFHTREGELGGIPRNYLIVLVNGDLMTGVILNKAFNVKTTYAKVAVPAEQIEHIAMTGERNVLTTIKMKGTGDQIQGILEDEDIEIDLDCGPVVKVYQDRIKEIYFQRGYGEKLDLPAGVGEVAAWLGAGGPALTNSIGMKLVLIRPGSFDMGSENGQDDEKPVHKVTITRPFYMGTTEVTQGQWQAVMGTNPSEFKGGDRPVEKVSWNDCQDFCRRLNEAEEKAGKLPKGMLYRLPTEAEWECACRAGSTTRFCFGDSDADLPHYAWFGTNSGKTTHPVAQKKPNAWGLHDMHGNVWEWCWDWYGTYPAGEQKDPSGPANGEYRVLRGGSWNYAPSLLRSAYRGWGAPDGRYGGGGFRVVLAPGPR